MSPSTRFISELTTNNKKFFVSKSEEIKINNLVGESYIGATTYSLEFVVQHHGLSKKSANVGVNGPQVDAFQHNQGFHKRPHDVSQRHAFNERDIATLEYQRQLEALKRQQQYIDYTTISNRRHAITMMRIVGNGCKCCEEKGCWDESCNRTKCRSGCNCW